MPASMQSNLWLRLIAAATGLVGLYSLVGGAWLVAVGGSLYYLLLGVALVAAALLLWRRRAAGLHVMAGAIAVTLAWAVWEIGFDWWQLVPRGDILFVLGALLLLPPVVRALDGSRWSAKAGPLALVLAAAGVVAFVSALHRDHDRPGLLDMATAAPAPGSANGDWPAYAGNWAGQKYAGLDQITPANVDRLQVAWQLQTGDRKRPTDPDETTYEMTPLKIGDTVYLCTPHNWVIAVDAEIGKTRWRFDPHVAVSPNLQHLTCRGVSYARIAASGDCAERLYMTTADARLIAIDARSGRPCGGFGDRGAVDLRRGMRVGKAGWYQGTSAPLIANGVVVAGGAVYDDVSTHVPSGVIRAYDLRTGALRWNFDPGKPGETRPLPDGGTYTPSTPNMWSTAAADPALGLAYFPMGMGAVDQWGGNRPATTERFATTILALDLATGKPRWAFQTVHHDLWDMDIPAQPTLIDLDVAGKGRVPALVQSTKTGNIFVLDRRDGRPVFPVSERPVPGGAAPGDHTSPTQPFSAVSLFPPRIQERDMWGGTMLDQLACRIRFRSLRYDGAFTPPSERGSIVFPGNFGVMDWGGIAVDPVRQVAFAHPNYMAFVDRLIPRSGAGPDAKGASGGSDMRGSDVHGYNPNKGAPFAVAMNPFLSPLGLPCQAPPWGYVAGLDLRTGKVAWRHANGTVRDETPLPLPFKMGVPSLGGPLVTAGGVAFLSSAIDDYVRAYDMRDGHVLWRARLPAGGQASPMSYRSNASGRQFVVVVAGGHSSLGTKLGDSVIAYALPAS